MTSLLALTIMDDRCRVYDGTRFHDGRQLVLSLLRSAAEVAVVDVATTHRFLALHGVSVPLVDVPALLRLEGYRGESDDVVRVGGDTDVLRAAYAIASRPRSPIENAVLHHTTVLNAEGIGIDRVRAAELASLYQGLREAARRDVLVHMKVPDDVLRSDLRFEEARTRQALENVLEISHARRRFIEFDNAASKMTGLAAGKDRAQDFLLFAGAHTGRFTSPGVALHSLPKHTLGVMSPLVRQREVIVPSPGRWLAARDLNAIEVRVLAFLANEALLVDRLRGTEDVYVWYAERVWPALTIEKGGMNGHLRMIAKEAMLSLGYGMGAKAFVGRVLKHLPSATDVQMERAFELYKTEFPSIAAAHDHAFAFLSSAVQGLANANFLMSHLARLDDRLEVQLPSGRSLHYRGLRIGIDPNGTETLWYSGDTSARVTAKQAIPWVRNREYCFDDGIVRRRLAPHTLVQNIVQATARDILVHQQARFMALEGVDVRVLFSVHDALFVECADNELAWEDAQDLLEEVMGEVPASLPRLASLPLSSSMEEGVRERLSPASLHRGAA
jgi:hypothetical protein